MLTTADTRFDSRLLAAPEATGYTDIRRPHSSSCRKQSLSSGSNRYAGVGCCRSQHHLRKSNVFAHECREVVALRSMQINENNACIRAHFVSIFLAHFPLTTVLREMQQDFGKMHPSAQHHKRSPLPRHQASRGCKLSAGEASVCIRHQLKWPGLHEQAER